MRLIPLALGGALVGALIACAGPGPVVDERVIDVREGVLSTVAVVPFYPDPALSHRDTPPPIGAIDAADVVARIVSDAFSTGGVQIVAPSDLIIAFEGHGKVLPRADVLPNAELAASDFGASAVLLGKVTRYREREGGAAGALRPASVAFEVSLYTAPGGELVYTGRFDQTQQSLSANPLLARKYPGGGTRWLTAAELTRWGADEVVATLLEVMQ